MIYFFHGLESGPHGRKFQALAEHFEVESPDFQGMDLSQRLAKAEALTRDATDAIVVGSSFGGLVAALLYAQHPARFFGYVLAAPAFLSGDVTQIARMPANCAVVHGIRDEVVPPGGVRAVCEAHGIDVIEVDDDHRLAGSIDVLIREVQRLVDARASR